ncbi:MAG: tetratricopeptide repeat protein, partial [Thermoguttaceae bacterium]
MFWSKKKKDEDEDDDPRERGGFRGKDDEEEGGEPKPKLNISEIIANVRAWAEANQTKTLIILAGIILFFILLLSLYIWHVISVRNRPTVEQAVSALEFGAFSQARVYAESVLRYVKKNDNKRATREKKATALFVLGASIFELYNNSRIEDKKSFYLTAANYLEEANQPWLPQKYKAKETLYLAKALYYSDNISKAIEALYAAEEVPGQELKPIYWLLANAIMKSDVPDYNQALHYCDLFLADPTTTQFERDEARLLRSHILLRLGRIREANETFDQVPILDELEAYQELIGAQLLIEEAREYRKRAIELEKQLFLKDSPFELHQETGTGNQPITNAGTTSTDNALEESQPGSDDTGTLDSNPAVNETETAPDESVTAPAPTNRNAPEPNSTYRFMPRRATQPKVPVLLGAATSSKSGAPTPKTLFVPKKTVSQGNIPVYVSDVESLPRTEARIRQVVFNRQDQPAGSAVSDESSDKSVSPDGVVTGSKSPSLSTSNAAKLLNTNQTVDVNAVQELRKAALDKYREAILRLEMSKNADLDKLQYSSQATLLQGIAYEEMGEFKKAQDMFSFLIRTYPSSNDTVAAEFRWAELERKLGNFESALSGYYRCAKMLKELGAYNNPILPLKEILASVESTFSEYVALKDFESGFRLLSVFKGVIPNLEMAKLNASGCEAWARDLRKRATASTYEESQKLNLEARDKFRLAGRWFAEVAKLDYTSPSLADYIWSSAENYREGKDYVKAIPMYKEYLKYDIVRRQAETLATLGQLYFELDLLDKSIETFDEYLTDYPQNSLVYQVRLLKSYAHFEKQELQQAEVLLLENLSGVLAPKSAMYRDTIYALGKMQFNAGDKEKAVQTLEDATFLHPDATQAGEAYYMIAQSYLSLVDKLLEGLKTAKLATAKEQTNIEIRKDRQLALNNFQKTKEVLLARENLIPLSKAEQIMLMVSYFEIAKQQLELDQTRAALESYKAAQNRYQSQ